MKIYKCYDMDILEQVRVYFFDNNTHSLKKTRFRKLVCCADFSSIYNSMEGNKAKVKYMISCLSPLFDKEWYRDSARSIGFTPENCSGANVGKSIKNGWNQTKTLNLITSQNINLKNDAMTTTKEPMSILIPLIEPILNIIADKVAERLIPVIREPKKVEQKFYTREEVCELLHISKPTLKKFSDQGLLNPIQMGDRRVLFDAEQIQQIVDSNIRIKYIHKRK